MKKFLTSIVLSLATFAPLTTHAAFNNIADFDARTGVNHETVYFRTKDGRIVPRVVEIYTNQKDKSFDQRGNDHELFILRTKYVPSYECATGIATLTCPQVQKGLQNSKL